MKDPNAGFCDQTLEQVLKKWKAFKVSDCEDRRCEETILFAEKFADLLEIRIAEEKKNNEYLINYLENLYTWTFNDDNESVLETLEYILERLGVKPEDYQ